MPPEDEDLRLSIYQSFASTGRPPPLDDDALPGLRRLAAARHLALDDADRIVMAHPFSAVPLGFSVMGSRTLWWGGCAWDSFAIPHLVPDEPEVLVATTCPGCGRPHAWLVDNDVPPSGDQVAHFLVPVAHMWDDVVHTCGNQRLFCDRACIDRWLDRTENAEGYVMDVPTLWRLARGWYAGRLERGYQRRDPQGAVEYLREVGLEGAFWGMS